MKATILIVLVVFVAVEVQNASGAFKKFSYYYPGAAAATDQYSSISDIDWSKRALRDNWISPAYGYASMADHDWGWRKRAAAGAEEDNMEDVKRAGEEDDSKVDDFWKRNYRPIALASRRLAPLRDRSYSYRSMADLDWGWRRKRGEEKRHLGSLHGSGYHGRGKNY